MRSAPSSRKMSANSRSSFRSAARSSAKPFDSSSPSVDAFPPTNGSNPRGRSFSSTLASYLASSVAHLPKSVSSSKPSVRTRLFVAENCWWRPRNRSDGGRKRRQFHNCGPMENRTPVSAMRMPRSTTELQAQFFTNQMLSFTTDPPTGGTGLSAL